MVGLKECLAGLFRKSVDGVAGFLLRWLPGHYDIPHVGRDRTPTAREAKAEVFLRLGTLEVHPQEKREGGMRIGLLILDDAQHRIGNIAAVLPVAEAPVE